MKTLVSVIAATAVLASVSATGALAQSKLPSNSPKVIPTGTMIANPKLVASGGGNMIANPKLVATGGGNMIANPKLVATGGGNLNSLKPR